MTASRTLAAAFSSMILIVAILAPMAARAAEVKERTTYFTVRGATLDEIDRDLARKGPKASAGSIRHPGATQVKFSGTVTYRPAGGTCRVAAVAMKLDLLKTLPRWSAPRAASPATVIIWKTLSDDIARHEGDHARIARLWLKKMESAVRNLRPEPSCDAMETKANETTARYLRDHERAQTEFDAAEGRDMNARLKRLLKRNVAEAATQ